MMRALLKLSPLLLLPACNDSLPPDARVAHDHSHDEDAHGDDTLDDKAPGQDAPGQDAPGQDAHSQDAHSHGAHDHGAHDHGSPAASAEGTATGTAEAAKALHITDARVRAMPPGSPNSGAFLQIHNPTQQHAALLSASSPVAKAVELHTHVEEGGQFKMRQVDRIDIAPDQAVSLAPGGLHIMLIGLTGDLSEGQQVPLTLVFEGGHRTELTVPVQKIEASAGKGASDDHGHAHGHGHGAH